MDIKQKRKEVREILRLNNIDASEADILFCETLDCTKSELFNKSNFSKEENRRINYFLKKRLSGKPIQKIFKKAYFFDYVFYINNNVLCPRPETEILVEEAIKRIRKESSVLDVCTGSGVIAITIQKKTGAKVYGCDISKKALYIAKKNAKFLNSDVCFFYSDMFKNTKEKFDFIISNPPYIPTHECALLDREVREYDPKISLDGGKDGLDFYRILARESVNHLNTKGKIFLEVGINEAKKVCNLLAANGFKCEIIKDYNNIDRIVIGELI